MSLAQIAREWISTAVLRMRPGGLESDVVRSKANEQRSVWDDFMMQEWEEFTEWLVLLSSINPRRGIEIGTGRGGSACMTLEVLPDLRRIVSVDVLDRSPEIPVNARTLLDRLILVQGESQRFATRELVTRMLESKPADFLFIDGNHSYENVAADYYFYAPLVRSGGLVAFHDIASVKLGYEHTAGVERFWNELCDREPGRCHAIGSHFG